MATRARHIAQIERFHSLTRRLRSGREEDRQAFVILAWAMIEHAVEAYCRVGRLAPAKRRSESAHAYHIRVIKECGSRFALRSAKRAQRFRNSSLYLCRVPTAEEIQRIKDEVHAFLEEFEIDLGS